VKLSRFLIIAFLISVLLLSSPGYAAFYSDPAIVGWESGNTTAMSYWFPVNPNPLCTEYPCNAVVNLPVLPGSYIDCSANPSGTIIGKWILDGLTNCAGGGAGTNTTCTNVCPAGTYFSWTRITGNGTWCHGGIQCYDVDIFASWESIETPPIPPVIPVCSFTAIPNSGTAPLLVTFTDLSTNTPTSWNWTITDNTTGLPVITSPLQTFQNFLNTPNRYYDVRMTAANGAGNCSLFYPVYLSTHSTGPSEGYALTITPLSVNYGANFTATITSSTGGFPGISEIKYGWEQGGTSDILYDPTNTDYAHDYSNISGTWYEFDSVAHTFSINRGAAIPTPKNATANFGTGLFTIKAYLIKTTGQVITLSASLTVTSAGMQTLTIDAKDFDTGALVSTAHIKVLNIATGAWDNRSASGEEVFYYPYSQNLYIEVPATGYVTANKNWSVTHVPTYNLWMIMYRGVTPPAANVTLEVEVIDWDNLATIPGALVHVYPTGQNGESKLTSVTGVATFNTSENTDYTISVSKYGYQNGGSIINTGPGGTAINEVIILHRAVAPTPTVTVPTAIPSGIPTTSPVGPAGNYTGFWAPFYNMFGAMGADAFTMQLLMACFFVFCGVVVGGFGMGTIIPGAPFSGTGAEAGGVFAFVLACAFGFINVLWIIVIFIWIAFRYFMTR